MDRRDYNNNMGPRLDLGLRPAKPAPGQETEPAPYRRQPAPPYHQQNQQANPSPNENHYPGQQAPADPYAQPGTYYDSRQYVHNEQCGPYGQQPGYEQRPGQHDRDTGFQQPPLYDHEESFGSTPGGVMVTAPAKPGLNRWLVWLALLLAVVALVVSLAMGRVQSVNQATLQMDSEMVPGATQERVAKLEKDVSSLLLKMVTLEKDLEAIKNRAWNPAALGEMNTKLAAMQKQIKELENKLSRSGSGAVSAASATSGASAPPAATTGPATGTATPPPTTGSSQNQPVATTGNNTPVATSQVQERAGDKPDPLATRMGGTATPGGGSASAAPPSGQPRHSYTVQKGDTLFSVAQRYQVTTKDLMQWNNMTPDDVLKVGKVLVIY